MNSIQDAREGIAKNHAALLATDGKFFTSLGERYNALKAKDGGGHTADFQRIRKEIGNWLHGFVNKSGTWSGSDDKAYEGAMAWVGLIDCEIGMRNTANAVVATSALNSGGPTGMDAGWINAETGKPVRVLAPNEPVFYAASRSDPDAPFGGGLQRQGTEASVGTLVAALLTGRAAPEIKAALSEGSDSAGGYSIPLTVLGPFIDRLRAKTQFIQAGARTVILDGMKTRILRVASDPAATWRAENGAVGEANPTFEAVDFLPKSLATLVKVPIELLQDSVNVEEALTAALVGALSVELDRASLFGSGTGNEPRGLFNTAGINSVSMGVNGATPASYDELIDAMYELEVDNAGPPTAAIMHPRTGRTLRKLKDSTAQPLRLPPALERLPFLSTTSVPIDQTQGTAASVCSTTLVGDYSQAMLGLRQELRIQRLDQTFAGNLQVGFIAHMRADVAFAHPESFCKIIGIKP